MNFQDSLSVLEQRPLEVASMESQIDAVEISNLPGHIDSQSQKVDIDNGLRLDDLSRRSACDRCKSMKMRCERPRKQFISQIQQCRRCSQANVRCLTTLEAARRQNTDRQRQRSRKRRRQESMEASKSTPAFRTSGRRLIDEQDRGHKTPSLEHQVECAMAETLQTTSPSRHAFSKPEDGVFPFIEDFHDECQELGSMMDWDGSGATSSFLDDRTRAMIVTPAATSDVALAAPNPTPDGATFVETTSSLSTIVQSTAGAPFTRTSQGPHSLFGAGLPQPSPPHLSNPQTPPTEGHWRIINKLMAFNTKLLHDLNELRGTNRTHGGGDDKGMLMVKVLQYSDNILELLSSVTRPGQVAGLGDSPDSSSPYSSGSASTPGPPSGASTSDCGEKVDTDLALMLLSCNANVSRLYELLCTDLATQTGLHLDAALLPLRLEGLQTLDEEMRIQVLVHVCFLKFTKIQKDLQSIRRLGLLTETADKAFQVVLGSGRALSPGCPDFGVEQIVGQLCRRVMAKGNPSS